MESKHEALEKMYFWLVVRDHLPDGDSLAEQATGQEQEAKEVLAKPASSRGSEGGSWTSSTARLSPGSCQPAVMRCSHVSGAYSLRAWVRPRGALTDSRKQSGNLSRQLLNAAGRGQR
jgi:hypothetical protein